MTVLDRKLLRDLWRLRTQVLAIALVMAAGVATLILGIGAHRSLEETRAAYYERQRFADIFAAVRRAPEALRPELAEIDGVVAVETRIVETALLDIDGMAEPGTAQLVSLPDAGPELLNRLYLRIGRLPDPARSEEVVVNEAFADAHGFAPGARLSAIVNGTRRSFTIVGIALSPEFIYALGPWDIMPDDRRFAVLWMPRRALAGAFDLDGAFSAVAVKLLPGASERAVIERLDEMLERYGSRGAYGRADQQSHAFIDAELQQLRAMSLVLPPIFLFVAAFLVNMTLGRLIALEREQIGLMKALGYASGAVAWHYLKLVLAIGVIGLAIGAVAGTFLGRGMTALYGEFYHFPFLIFRMEPAIYVAAAGVTLAAAAAGALRAVWNVAALSPAVAMQPPAPTRYRRLFKVRPLPVSETTTMMLRHIVRWPVRAGFTIVGIALSVAVLVGSLFSEGAVEYMIDVTFFQADRQDASIDFVRERPVTAIAEVERLPGVLAAEPVRAVAVRVTSGHVERRIAVLGKPAGADLSRVLDLELEPVRLPETGIVLSDKLAELLRVGLGDLVEAETLEGAKQTVELPVTAIVQGYFGLTAYMDITAANRLMGEGPMMTGVHVRVDPLRQAELYGAVKALPMVGSIALQRLSVQKFRDTLAENILIMNFLFVTLAGVIAFGVVYNSARIQLSERARELASLRVLGFTRGEVSWILLAELSVLTLLALPLGWLLGYGMVALMVAGFETELFRVPFVVGRATFAKAALAVIAAAAVSALIVRRRIDRLDLVEVLKTRE
jgi:putative ABC transport system permease protein